MFGLVSKKSVDKLQAELKNVTTEFENKLSVQYSQIEKASKENFAATIARLSSQIFPNYQDVKLSTAYQTLDDLYSVVSRIATTAALIPFYAENKDGTEVKDSDKLYEFINSMTTEQRIEIYTYFLLKGEAICYKEKLDVGVNAGMKKLVPLNPDNVSVFVTKSFPYQILGYRYWDNLNGEFLDFLPEEILHVKLPNPDVDITNQVRGLPPVKVLSKRLARISAGMDSSTAQIQNGGVPSIVYDKTPGFSATTYIDGKEVSTLGMRRDAFSRFLQNSANKGAPYFASGEMGVIELGSTMADMDLATLSAIDLDKICNVYHVSSTEFNNKSASTESNVKTHSKAFYTNGVLPIVVLFRDGLNAQVLPDIKTQAIIKEDITDITELQPDMKAIADALAALPVMKPNDVLEKFGYEAIKDELMEKFYIKSGYQPIDEMGMQVPGVDNSVGDYNNTGANVVPIKRAANG